ncbi:hypothetical protein J3A83DRAFT_4109663 [Scleroderma citrinum]
MALYETPSRIWRRIQDEREPPSLPSLPEFEYSVAPETVSNQTSTKDEDNEILPVHSTPIALSSNNHILTAKLQSSTSSTARFATSIASRSVSAKSSASHTYTRNQQESFNISAITSLPHSSDENVDSDEAPLSKSANSVPEVYLPPVEADEGEDMSLVDALESVSRSSSPLPPEFLSEAATPKKGLKYDYSISLRSEPKPSPFDKYRNVALRKPITRARTPSLSRTTSSPPSSPPDSTPRSNRSIQLPRDTPSPTPGVHVPLPRSASASPAVMSLPSFVIQSPQEETPSNTEEQEPSSDRYGTHETSEAENVLESDGGNHGHHETTFSSSSDPSHPMNTIVEVGPSTIMPPSANFSPVYTPTPVIAPRPRAQFNVNYLPCDPDAEEEPEIDSGPVTPRTRRRSFLLSVINSTARPRMKAPTPHPRRLSAPPVSEVSSDDTQETPVGPLRKAFVGITPRPGRGRARLSHPLTQVLVPETAESASETGDGNANSAYDSAGERMSVISTASSHDLTTHVRANTSYDPAVGLGERGRTGRFDAQKLNTYLHVLNRRLQDENIALVERLRMYEEVKPGPRLSIASSGRRVSAASALGNVEEDACAEGWEEEKLELEAMVQRMEEDIEKLSQDKIQLQKSLDGERNDRERYDQRWQERMQEVEKGVTDIITELEGKAAAAENQRAEAVEEIGRMNRDAGRMRERLESERDLAMERAAQAEIALESGKELGGALREANSKVSALTTELQAAAIRIEELEGALGGSQRHIGDLKQELKEERLSYKLAQDDFHGQLSEMGSEVMRATARIAELDKMVSERELDMQRLEKELRLSQGELSELEQRMAESEADAANEIRRLKTLVAESGESNSERFKLMKGELSIAHDRIVQSEMDQEQANEHIEMLEKEIERHSELTRHLEEALEAAEEKTRTDEQALSELRAKLTTMEREQERQQALGNQPSSHDVEEALEAELDEANKEVARLNTLLEQSPARKAIEKAKDARIEMLERERDDLLERIKTLKTNTTELATPSKIINMSGISPIHRHVLAMSTKAPKTPGKPLRDLSWLNSTAADPTTSPLLAEIARLQSELDRANESIDQKLDQLEDAGFGVVGLTKSLEDARQKLVISEKEIARLQRREERHLRRLERIRCQKCLVRISPTQLQKICDLDESSMDISQSGLPSNPPTPPTKSSEALRLDLQSVNAQLDAMRKEWRAEKQKLLNEKAILEDTASRMKIEARIAKEETKKVMEAEKASRKWKTDNQEEGERAKAIISDLEAQLQAERTQLRQMSTEHDRLERETLNVARQLQRTEADMEDVKRELHRAKLENHELENELRGMGRIICLLHSLMSPHSELQCGTKSTSLGRESFGEQ